MVWYRRDPTFAADKSFSFLILFYDIFIFLLKWTFRLASVRNIKARKWVGGRKKIWEQLSELQSVQQPIIWVHSASTGEFEQAKPLIEEIRKSYPNYFILGTFFSPSGYEAANNYSGLDLRCYLPVDTPRNAKKFFAAVKPALVIFSKYDFWYHHLRAVDKAGVPLLLISAIFRPGQSFFNWYGGFQRIMLRRFTHIFVQDETSRQLLQQQGIGPCSIGGDTRFDRVLKIRENKTHISLVQRFAANDPVLVAGSTWPSDEALLQQLQDKIKMVIAPHEITPDHISALQQAFPRSVLFSDAVQDEQKADAADVLIINNIGMLSRLYQYGTITYVGGGFTASGIHNTLEAAVWGKPVIIGPNFKKYLEAKGLIAAGGALSVKNDQEFKNTVHLLLNNEAALAAASEAAEQYAVQNAGATGRIMQYIQEKRLLTRL